MKNRKLRHVRAALKIALVSVICIGGVFAVREIYVDDPGKLLVEYMDHIEKQEYSQMYDMLDHKKSSISAEEDFIERNSRIYEGIKVSDISVQNIKVKKKWNGEAGVSYDTNLQTAAGPVQFANTAEFSRDWKGYHLIWQDQLIFPNLTETDKVRVESQQAERGDILDRNGYQIAGKGTASSVGIVPGKMQNRDETVQKLAECLGTDEAGIYQKLDAEWVKEDSFVPVTVLPKIQETEIYSDNIYFAKAALKIGANQLMQSLNHIGFIYTAFLNNGNIIKPYLRADESTSGEIWIKDAFSPQTVSEVMEGLKGVVNNPEGTGYSAYREDITLAGKTGTAELKATKEDTSGTEIGWFAVFTADKDAEKSILLISMVENVKDIGGSSYVVAKDKAALDEYLEK